MNEDETLDGPGPVPPAASRRAVLAGAGAVAVAVLGGCATYDQSAPPAEEVPPPPDPVTEEPAEDEDEDKPTETKKPKAPPAIVQAADVPVGGGVVLSQRRLVVTQPSKGKFKCFTAVCTHQGCVVGDVGGGTINCPCHGSKFKIADGSVAKGPAGRPLREVPIEVNGDGISLA